MPEYWIVDPLFQQIEVHVLEPDTGVYRQAQTAGAGDKVRSVLLPNLTAHADRVFTLP